MSKSGIKTFDTIVQKEGSFTFVAIPFLPRDIWGAQPRFRVTGTINGLPVRGTLGASGQAYFLRLSAKWMRDGGIEPGTHVTVRLSLDDTKTGSALPARSKPLSDKEK